MPIESVRRGGGRPVHAALALRAPWTAHYVI
jgi:hypothetical protein